MARGFVLHESREPRFFADQHRVLSIRMLCEETEAQQTQEVVQGTYKEVFYFTFFIAVRKYFSQKQLGEGMGHN